MIRLKSTIYFVMFAMAAVLVLSFAGQTLAAEYATGIVFEDSNKNGVYDAGEKGIENVRVSNGRIIVRTNSSGRYNIPVSDDTIIFVIKPRDWKTRVDENNVPRFYYIHKPKGSPPLLYRGVDPTGPLPTSVDFPLYRSPEPDKFQVVLLGDSQVTNEKEVAYFARDIVEELAGSSFSFGVMLGDNVNDILSLYDPLIRVVGKMGFPVYYVKGNHDTNYDASTDVKLRDETFERFIGPAYYSFDYGNVHFIVLDNAWFTQLHRYEARLDADQFAFLRNDLALVPKDQLVVLLSHIPFVEMKDLEYISELFKDRPNVLAVSAHYHTNENKFLDDSHGWKGAAPLHVLVNVTTCGSWWAGAPDELSIPHTTMRDGAPNGYSIAEFDGNKYSIRFKAARRPADYQMNIYAPDLVALPAASETQVLANIFGGSEKSTVEMKLGENGSWIKMEPKAIPDPMYAKVKEFEDSLQPRPGATLPKIGNSPHIWAANLPKPEAAGTYIIYVRTTDMYGETYLGRRIIEFK